MRHIFFILTLVLAPSCKLKEGGKKDKGGGGLKQKIKENILDANGLKCPKDHVPDKTKNACLKMGHIICQEGFAIDETKQFCTKQGEVKCADTFTFDSAKNGCVKDGEVVCLEGFTLDADTARCLQAGVVACPETFTFDTALNACTKQGEITCAEGFSLNDSKTACVHFAEVSCQAGTKFSPELATCVAMCSSGYKINPDNLECELVQKQLGYTFKKLELPAGMTGTTLKPNFAMTDKYAAVEAVKEGLGSVVLFYRKVDGNWVPSGVEKISSSSTEFNKYAYPKDDFTNVATTSNGLPLSGFGESIALAGDWAFIGAPKNNRNGTVFVYKTKDDGATWSKKAMLLNDIEHSTHFGLSISLSSETALIHFAGSNDGIADFEDQSISLWKLQGESWQKLTDSSMNEPFSLGQPSTDFSGAFFAFTDASLLNINIQGISFDRFKKEDGTKNFRIFHPPFDGDIYANQEKFGRSISFDNNRVAVGIPGYKDKGAISIWVSYDELKNFHEEFRLVPEAVTSAEEAVFAKESKNFKLEGDYLYAGDYRSDVSKLYIYKLKLKANTEWVLLKEYPSPDASCTRFGSAISASNGDLMVGCETGVYYTETVE